MAKGRLYPSEAKKLHDPKTGVLVWQITDHPSINHHLYFLTSSTTPNERHIVFASTRSGRTNFYLAGFPSGDIVQLTDGERIHGFSGTLDRSGTVLYFTAGGEVRSVDLRTLEERTLADFSPAHLGECSLNAEGRWLISAAKFPDRFAIVATRTDGSQQRTVYESPRTIIHPQFHPADPTLIEFAHDPAPRMHFIRLDGSGFRCLWEHGNDEFLVHETFLDASTDLIVVRWPYALQRFSPQTGRMETIARLNAWHICPTRNGRYVICDTAHPDVGIRVVSVRTGLHRPLCYPESSNRGSQWRKDRYALLEDWERASQEAAQERSEHLSWMEMEADTVYGPQWTHPHPSLSASERWVIFTSDRTGHPQVYAARIPDDFFAQLDERN
ncbi:MAG: oligogalacturonate lyase [Candidatus Poribacteria bacterium]|nr:MAG: oligogalacturonate lyase [Candidatus Poribacteria bacterium]